MTNDNVPSCGGGDCSSPAAYVAPSVGYSYEGQSAVGVLLLCEEHKSRAAAVLPDRLALDVTAATEGWPTWLVAAINDYWPAPVPL